MMKVPTLDTFQKGATTLTGRVAAPEYQDFSSRQMQETGRALQGASGVAEKIAEDQFQLMNQAMVDGALNQAKETALDLTYGKDSGYANLKGISAIKRPDGVPLIEEYGGKLRQRIDDLSNSLGNPEQRRIFAQHAAGILQSFQAGVTKHEASEAQTYELSVADGIQATALREIGERWNEPDAIDAAVFRIRAQTYRQAQLLGKSAEWQEAQARKMTSNAHKVALLTALEQNDPAYAEAYMKKYAVQMDADDMLSVRGHITKAMDARVAFSAASDVISRMQPRIAVSEGERAFNIALGTESGGKQFAVDGAPLTSPKGAVGIAQVMPGTGPEAARLAGVPWDENRYRADAGYNKAIGLAYFQKQLQDNGGDLAKAYAAYNAGPGRLQEAIKKADRSVSLNKNDPTVPVRTWLDFMPAETRNYVAKNMGEFEAGGGQPARPTFQEIDDRLRADPRLAANPVRYKAAREEAERQFNEQTKAIKQREEEAVATAMRGVLENGGRYTDLPLSIRAAVPPKEVDSVINFAQKIAKGDDTTSLWLYNDMASNPNKYDRMDDNAFYALRRELSESDFKHFVQERAKRNGAVPGGNGPGDLNSQGIKQALDDRLRMLGTDPTPKDSDTAEMSRVGAIRKFVNDYFVTAQREAGKKFSDAEVAKHIDALFAQNATFRSWFSDSSGPMLMMKTGDIPGAEKKAITAAFARQGITNPTDAQILDIYWKRQIARK